MTVLQPNPTDLDTIIATSGYLRKQKLYAGMLDEYYATDVVSAALWLNITNMVNASPTWKAELEKKGKVMPTAEEAFIQLLDLNTNTRSTT